MEGRFGLLQAVLFESLGSAKTENLARQFPGNNGVAHNVKAKSVGVNQATKNNEVELGRDKDSLEDSQPGTLRFSKHTSTELGHGIQALSPFYGEGSVGLAKARGR
mmetsp:Transcript_29561/g.77806  ORF Transcript_29561/g.77806 Transcript_29561/m.77806 type:complete len:106 (-) Transcript_29561:163-480(-)